MHKFCRVLTSVDPMHFQGLQSFGVRNFREWSVCFSHLFLTSVSHVYFSLLFLTSVSHVYFSHLFLMSVSHICSSRLFITSVYHVCFSLLFLTPVSYVCFSHLFSHLFLVHIAQSATRANSPQEPQPISHLRLAQINRQPT